jgi:hypothetical protein
MCFWPDKLRRKRWRHRCQFIGLERLEAALAEGRPVILTTLHYGDMTMLYHWLRSRGIGVAFLSARKRKSLPAFRNRLDSLADRVNGLEGVPRLIHPDQLWDAQDFLRIPHRVLAIAMERKGERAVTVNGPGYVIHVSPGALCLADIVGAVVIPCLISSPRCLFSTIRFGEPVADADVANRDRHVLACEHIVHELMSWIAEKPEACGEGLLASIEPQGGPAGEASPRDARGNLTAVNPR